jgi:S1-C subfamily serine protease
VVPEAIRKRAGLAALSLAAVAAMPVAADGGAPATIARIKASIVAVGTFERLRNPQFSFAGTGFVVGDGLLVATNDHVVPKTVSGERGEDIAVAVPAAGGTAQIRIARKTAASAGSDLALLRIEGKPLPPLAFGDATAVREGESYLVTGFPIGSVLGLFPVTHRAMIAAVTPIAIPAARADQLDARSVRRLSTPSFHVFQLDGTAYPGNSGSPVYHPESGAVIGIVNSVFVKGTREAALAQPSGITYAIPARQLIELLQDAR